MGKTKICMECGAENNPRAKFCQECGNSIREQTAKKYCKRCGSENEQEARFCFNCGEALQQPGGKEPKKASRKKKRPRAKKKTPQPSQTNNMTVLKIGAVLFAGLIIYMLIPQRQQPTGPPPANIQALALTEQKSNDPRLEAELLDIAAKFICSCGTCGEQPLNTCTCEVAVAERQFIRGELQAKKDSDSIIRTVNEKYGWIKPQYREKYGAGRGNAVLKTPLPAAPGLKMLTTPGDRQVALPSDRLAIISSFACTCGQCGIDELKDCNCSHPGGALEVKNFIDQKISEGKYTKENIVEIVDARYGNRIR